MSIGGWRDDGRMRIGVALSGGGHRATAWGFGVLAGLVASGNNRDVASIASVSGGSIANGVVAVNADYWRYAANWGLRPRRRAAG